MKNNAEKKEDNILKEMQDSIGGDVIKNMIGPLIGRIKPFIPTALKGLEASDDFLRKDETIVIGKNQHNQFVILKGKTDNISYTLKSKEGIEKISLSGLVEQLLSMIVEEKKD